MIDADIAHAAKSSSTKICDGHKSCGGYSPDEQKVLDGVATAAFILLTYYYVESNADVDNPGKVNAKSAFDMAEVFMNVRRARYGTL